ncbi:MAG: right-handed parallel beta-helix repeat-containing protein [Candidatus Aminicenantes bacterium]
MKIYKIISFGIITMLVAFSLTGSSFGQDVIEWDEDELAKIVDSPKTKRALGKNFDGAANIDFDMDTLVNDRFRTNVIVATVDFEHVPSGKQGTASFAYRWEDMEMTLIHSSYWLWGTVVSGNLAGDTTWNSAGSPYYVTDYVQVPIGVTLTIEPGTVVRFRKAKEGTNYAEINVFGALNCQNATFTSSCDFETYDDSQAEWNKYDWDAIYIFGDGECTMDSCLIEYARFGLLVDCTGNVTVSGSTIRRCYEGIEFESATGIYLISDNELTDCDYGLYCQNMTSSTELTGNTITCAPKWEGYSGIYCTYSSPVIASNEISGFSYGIMCRYDSYPEVNSNSILNNVYGIRCNYGASPIVHNNDMVGNANYGLYNDGVNPLVDAENNWWGDVSGPYHATLNPSGLGDTVSDYVDFDPWLTSAVTMLFVLPYN